MKRNTRGDKRRWLEKLAVAAQQAADSHNPRETIGVPPEDASFDITALSQREITAAIKQLKNNKADDDAETLSFHLQLILQEVWDTESIPMDGRIVKHKTTEHREQNRLSNPE